MVGTLRFAHPTVTALSPVIAGGVSAEARGATARLRSFPVCLRGSTAWPMADFTKPSVILAIIAGLPELALKRSGRAMFDAQRSIADEVEAAIKAGSAEKHLETVKRVTALFLLSADSFGEEQIELF